MSNGAEKNRQISECVEEYRAGRISRRELLASITVALGGYTAAHLFLETSGLAGTLISTVEAQSANVDAETVSYRSGQFDISGYLTKPKGAGPYPGVIVIHENRGLNEHIRDVARRFATEGFVALAPDLLSRLGGTGQTRTAPAGAGDTTGESNRPADAAQAIARLPLMGVIDDLRAGLEFLAKDPSVDPARLGSVGFCWGGWRSFMLATTAPNLRKAVLFYGSSPDTGFDKIQASVLAHYGEWDNQITGNALWTKEVMERAGKKFQYYVYPKTDHAFFNDTGPRYAPEAAKLAWQRTVDFLNS
jgi:carboxymethylenebutenolidase